ncbi:MAG: hypothetical protein UY62_C0006G0016 [Parcubacteria group bacterium GW2011_GWF2_50_9]|nr:MAG: hypothetical protein UY62_C0006G0016 [Parcubacteria group bacterium GW2011_GWF2_50_9]
MAILESQLSQQVVGNLAADILSAEPAILGLIQASQFIDGLTPKGKTRITLNWTAPTRNEFIGGELLKNPDGTPDLADGVAAALHETQFDPIVAGAFTVFERTAVSSNTKTLTASAVHGQRIINIGTPVPADIIVGAKIVVDDGVSNKEEYIEVKAVNTLTGDITLVDGLFYPHASGAVVKQAVLSSKALATHYTLELTTGVLTELAGGFTAGNRIAIRYQATLQDLDHYELYRVPGNAPVSVPTKANVLAASGVSAVSSAIPSTATSFQDQTPLDPDNGKDFTYYLFGMDDQGNASNLASEVMTQNPHMAFVELIPTIVQNLSTDVSSNKVNVSWDAVSDPNANGYNIFRSPGATFDPVQAVKANSTLIPKGTGRVSFDDSAGNVSNRRPSTEVPYPVDGQTYAYKIETEDTTTYWTDGTSNIPTLDTSASKTSGAGDGTGGR